MLNVNSYAIKGSLLIFILSFTLACSNIKSEISEKSYTTICEIYFDNSFDNNNLTFIINKDTIFTNQLFKIKNSFFVYQCNLLSKDSVYFSNSDNKYLSPLSLFDQKIIDFYIIRNTELFTYKINLEKGKYLIFYKDANDRIICYQNDARSIYNVD